ncbi:TPR-like protein [Amniculicola lignicola CBS 123094]|uniref:TPR-like protein n=1 Tax=Amniculicola lignicola CBS 123094 TaxID=1392246 RepID=A0A6A5W002_9PLEO|nr:TPR-like protein [Amniculicola lignicola CBS 123094]
MATAHYGNGVNGNGAVFPAARYSAVPPHITVPVPEDDDTFDVEIQLDDEIQDDPTELCTLLSSVHSAKNVWMTVAIGYAKHKKLDVAIEVLSKAVAEFAKGRAEDRLSILNALCWLYLLKCREAPRVLPDGKSPNDVRLKDYYIQAATSVLNDASRISPSYPPLFLARGVLYLLRASLQPPTTSSSGQMSADRMDTLKQAAKCFEDALRNSNGKNLMAKMGKARVNYTMGRYAEALKLYQNVLESSPDLIDPDPRIGIGCCFWQLGFKDDAAGAWQRSLELNPQSKIALILLGIYNFQLTAPLVPSDPNLLALIRKAMDKYISPAFQLDKNYPLSAATLGSFFVVKKDYAKAETLGRRAIELTDVNAIASDGWYQLARAEHAKGDTSKATDCYQKADVARGGEDRGYIPAKFGSAQMKVIQGDYDGAKFRLEKILQQQSTFEAQVLLGTLYAEDVFSPDAAKSTEEKANDTRKALKLLEDVTKAWKDAKKKASPDQSVLLNLARLYEDDYPEKSLKCLEEVEQMELDAIDEDDYPEGVEDEASRKRLLRELLPPQLLNNMGCFHYQSERYVQARELFQSALNACVTAATKDASTDTDALVTSISYNLGRTYEAEGMVDEARDVYNGLLSRHGEYVDAQLRLAYIALRQSPTDEGPKAVKALYESNKTNLEVRTLMGWYISRSKKRSSNFADDAEQHHHKHTLQDNGSAHKHDRYALVGMGNINLTIAREMRRDTEAEKEKRRKTYERAVEFFDKVLQIDPKNAYAVQGIAIALAEDKKNYPEALQAFTKVKETLKDYSVFMNLGHVYVELKQYSRAIENYEIALSKERARDPTILSCLGRVWLLRAKKEQSLAAMKTALEYSERCLEIAPDNLHFQFNVAFVQISIAGLVNGLKNHLRTCKDIKTAKAGLDEAIETFIRIAKAPNPPFPRYDIEQRANMGRNTMRGQAEEALKKQEAYENQNTEKLQAARAQRDAELRAREEEKRKAEEAAAEERRKIREERERLAERDREYMEKRVEEDRRRQELIDDSEMRKTERGARRKQGGGGSASKRKKANYDDSETEAGLSSDAAERPRRRRTTVSGDDGGEEEERPRQKKRKLERKSKVSSKFKSAETIVDSDVSDDDAAAPPATSDVGTPGGADTGDEGVSAPRSRKAARVISEDEDEDDGGAVKAHGNGDLGMDDDEDE